MKSAFGVVLLNWNNSHETLAALDSLFEASPRPARVVVIDNDSHDQSIAKLSQWRSDHRMPEESATDWLEIKQLQQNAGFAGGNNAGIALLLSDPGITHVLLLNNDAMVEMGFFARIGDALAEIPDAGLLTGTIYEHPNRKKVWYAGGHDIPFRALIAHDLEVPHSSDPVQTEFISGCAMVISRELISRIGVLPEIYFPLYSEDAEYSYRARTAGFPVVYAPAAVVYHKVGATVGRAATSPFIMRTQVRHRVLYVRRNFNGLNRYVACAYLLLTKPAKAVVEVLKGRPKMGWAVLAGTIEGFVRGGR